MGKLTEGDSNTGGSWFQTKVLKEGPVKIRLLSAPVVGYERWTAENKPMRAESLAELLETGADWRTEDGKANQAKFFASFFIWNHAAKAIQIAVFSQKTIRQQLEALENNEDWGDLTTFDITLSRTDAGEKVTYVVQPSPTKPLPADAVKEWERVQAECVGLAALYSGGDPMTLFGG